MDVRRATEAIERFVNLPITGKVVDIGSGNGEHAEYLREKGLSVVTVDLIGADICGSWPIKLDFKAGAIWCSHTLEHSRNPGLFLDACFDALSDNGWMAITVPPLKPQIVGGHVTLWNAGLLLYHLILAGFDCSKAMVKKYGYNISVIVQKKAANLPPLKNNYGDIESLSHFFPFPAIHGFDGTIRECNWTNP